MSQVFLESLYGVTSSRVIKDFGNARLVITIHMDERFLHNEATATPNGFLVSIQRQGGFMYNTTLTFKETDTVPLKGYEWLVSKIGKEAAAFMTYGDVYGAMDHIRLERLIATDAHETILPFLALCKNPGDFPKQVEHWKKYKDQYVLYGGKLTDLEPVVPKTYYRRTDGPIDWSYVIKETELGIYEVKLLEQFNQAKPGDIPVPFNVDFIPFDEEFRAKDLERIESVCPTMGVHLNAIRKYGAERLDWIINSNLTNLLDARMIAYKFNDLASAKSVPLLLLVSDPMSFKLDVEYWATVKYPPDEIPNVVTWVEHFSLLNNVTEFK